MYLKSLTLRGFKSFADKTTLVFDPGLTVVVGPNGSGKSNISDSILWVLGEQSPKMLRGQAMEDVIFAGSSARGSVSVAEVTLVLDNTDGTLPVDHSEVAVTRRVYRSGESEYLINNAPCRLMDIVDILHDSGLGRDMHSIISQGNLDSILSSRPEERRELVEEAAGISKHRRRKVRSERRLKSMDDNLVRAKDISREIARQLRPLERQVGKAKQAREVQERLKELSLALAVDDLRLLQERHAALDARVREGEAAVSVAELRVKHKTGELERYQSLLEEKGLFVGDLGAQRARAQAQLQALDGDLRLLDNKARSMSSRAAQLKVQASSAARELDEAAQELQAAQAELSEARAAWEELRRQNDELAAAARTAKSRRQALGQRLAQTQADARAAQREADAETLAHAKLRDQVGNARVEDELFEGRLRQIDEQLASQEDRLQERKTRMSELDAELKDSQERVTRYSEEARAATSRLETAREREREASETLARQKASLAALESVDEQAAQASPLVAQVLREPGAAQAVECRLSDLIEAPEELEHLVERLLGDDLSALVVATSTAASHVVQQATAAAEKAHGKLTLLSRDLKQDQQATAQTNAPGTSLFERLRVDAAAANLVEALLGDVRLVATIDDALSAHCDSPWRTYVTQDGVAVRSDGRVVVNAGSEGEEGALERKRRIRLLREGMQVLEEGLLAAEQERKGCEKELNAARDAVSRAKGDAAQAKGERSSAASETTRLEAQLRSARTERERVERQRREAQGKARDAESAIERHRVAANEAQARAEQLNAQAEALADERSEASRTENDAQSRVSDARLKLATVQERKNHLVMRKDELERRLRTLRRTAQNAQSEYRDLSAKLVRIAPLKHCLNLLRNEVEGRRARLDDSAQLAQADSESLKSTIGNARSEVDTARSALESARTAVTQASVELGKVEVRVQTAVSSIEELGFDLAEALSTPAPEDREKAEAECERLRRELAAIGPVNEVAMDEYSRLKTRADYLAEQVADLESARKSLAKITAAIERKMRRQFLVVFDQVNANFAEVFSLLFPGGQAHLEMTDPDHLSTTGIEVVAQPRGKKIQKMTLMSGGEKSLTALALLFAVYKTRTVPFYVFDEVEAALDDSNLGKLLDAMDELRKTTQLIVISHQRRTMENADVLYGVSMQADGVSHVVSQRLDRTGAVVEA